MRRLLECVFAVAAIALANVAGAQNWPTKSVRVIVPWGPGGGTDIVARAITARLSENLKQQFVVDNRGGANGILGTDLGAKSPGDGYTLVLHTLSSHVLNTSYYRKLPYDPEKDLTPITLVGRVPLVLYTHPSFPVKTPRDLVNLARANAGQVQYGSFATGSPSHFAAEIMAHLTKIKLVHIPYKGGGAAMTALLGGEVPFHFGGVSVGLPHVKAGKIRALAVTSSYRSPALPELPTLAEALKLQDYDVSVTFGVLVPASMPKNLVQRIFDEFAEVIKSEAYKSRLATLGTDEAPLLTPEELGRWLQKETARWAGIIKATGIRAE
ncbi:MAG: tripartite tricarboxylate transporter substrate binding protein [Pseudomonadota bacterium]